MQPQPNRAFHLSPRRAVTYSAVLDRPKSSTPENQEPEGKSNGPIYGLFFAVVLIVMAIAWIVGGGPGPSHAPAPTHYTDVD